MRNMHVLPIVKPLLPGRKCFPFIILGLLAIVSSGVLSAQQALIADIGVDLPNAPGFQEVPRAQSPSADPASMTGTVSDIRGGLVPDAEITLTEKGRTSERQTTSNSEGNFTFTGIAPGTYTVTIASPGLEKFLSPPITLRPGERFELPDIALPIASATTSVDVVMTEEEVATEELKLETQQRVLAIFPNFYTSFLWNAAPLNTKQKFKLSFRATTDPVAFLTAGIVAGIEQANNTFPGYGDDAASYGKRYAAAYGDALLGRTLGSAIFPSIFHQDPRYFYMGPASSTRARLKHALLAGIVARGDNGHWQPNYSHIAGNAAAGALSSVYHPASNSAGSLAAANALIGIGGGAFQGIIREFLWSHLTSKVPSYAKGKPATATHP